MKQQKEVRQNFKSISTFNGKAFAARVGFDVPVGDLDQKQGLPKPRDSALPNVAELEQPLFDFIVKFIEAYDNNREGLFNLYAKDAVFTMGVGVGTDVQKYRQHQRNMIAYHRGGYNPGMDKYRTPRKFLMKSPQTNGFRCKYDKELEIGNHCPDQRAAKDEARPEEQYIL